MTGASARQQQDNPVYKDGHAPEVVPAEGESKPSKAKPARSAMKKSKSHGKLKAASEKLQKASEAKTSPQAGAQVDGATGSSYRKSASPVFLSPAQSFNSKALSSGGSLGQQERERDSFADAAAAAVAASSPNVKAASSEATSRKDASASTKLSSAALKSLDSAKGSKASKASSRASAKSHSRSSSVAEWHDVELQSEAEDEAHHDKAIAALHQSGPPPAQGFAAALAASDSDNDSELGIAEGEQHNQEGSASSGRTAQGELLLLACLCMLVESTQVTLSLPAAVYNPF